MRIGLDAMGGDNAPHEIVKGAVDALELSDELEIVLFGDEEAVRDVLATCEGPQDRLQVIHCASQVGMADSPVEVIKHKRDSSLVKMVKAAAKGRIDAVISAGNTGAAAVAAHMLMKPLEAVHRPGIAVVLPSFHGPIVVCDAGANIAAKPHHLHQYAIMASIYSRAVIGVESPRVGLLSIGEEDNKGTSTIKQARQYLSGDPGINFIGNVEGRDLFRGKCDVVTCDGFAGNLVLKLTEGLAEGLFKTIAYEIQQAAPELISAFEPVVKKIWMTHDYSEFGGAPLLGINGVCIICHGRSDARAIRNAVRVASEYVSNDLNKLFAARLHLNGEAR